jgi:hypothetical protein
MAEPDIPQRAPSALALLHYFWRSFNRVGRIPVAARAVRGCIEMLDPTLEPRRKITLSSYHFGIQSLLLFTLDNRFAQITFALFYRSISTTKSALIQALIQIADAYADLQDAINEFGLFISCCISPAVH